MTPHVQRSNGAGMPPGLRLSYQAISLILLLLTGIVSLIGFVRAADLNLLASETTRQGDRIAVLERQRQEDLALIRHGQEIARQERVAIASKLDRIETRLSRHAIGDDQ